MTVCLRVLLVLACLTPAAPLRAATLAEAQELFRARRYVEARTAFEQVAVAEPGNAEAAYRLGLLALMRDDQAEAVKRLEQATRLAPEAGPYFQALGDAYGLSTEQAGLFSKLSLARKCRAAYEQAVALEPGSIAARYALFAFYRQAPVIVGGGFAKARAQAIEIQKLDVVRGTLALVEMDVAEKKYSEAFAALAALRQSHPEAIDVPYQIGRTAAMSGLQLDQGEAAIKEYLQRSPGEEHAPLWAAHWRLGQILERKGDRAAARAEYAAALQLNPAQPQLIEAMSRVK
jgi:tetratricopeptide (TPR) repeat protein